MILSTEQTPDVNIQSGVKVLNDFQEATSIAFIEPTTSFSSLSDIQTEATWLTGVKAKTIIPIHDIMEVVPSHDDSDVRQSLLGFSYTIHDGKYKFGFRVDYDDTLYKRIKLLTGRNLDIALWDGKYLFAKDTFKGLQNCYIDVRKLVIGQSTDPILTEIIVEFDASELDSSLVTELTWDFNDLFVAPVQISGLTTTTTTSHFTVLDDTFSAEVSELTSSDFVITDDGGAINITSLTELRYGYYKMIVDSALTKGNISILATNYYTSTVGYYNYTSVLDVVFANVTNNGLTTELEFDLTEFVSGDPVTAITAWIVTDTDNGVLTDTPTHNGAGNWTLAVASPYLGVSGGTIAVSDAGYSGSTAYVYTPPSTIFVTFQNITFLSRTRIEFDVINAISLDPITDTIAFELDDDSAGTINVTSSSQASNHYELVLDASVVTTGTVSVTTSGYDGESDYTYAVTDFTINEVYDYHISHQILSDNSAFVIQILDTDNNPIVGSIIADFTLDDDSLGSITIPQVLDFTGDDSLNWIVVDGGASPLTSGTLTFNNGDGAVDFEYNVTDIRMLDNMTHRYTPGSLTYVGLSPTSLQAANVLLETSVTTEWMDMAAIAGGEPTDLRLTPDASDVIQWTFDLNEALVNATAYKATIVFTWFNGSGTLSLTNGAQSTVITSAIASAGTVEWEFTANTSDPQITYQLDNSCTIYISKIEIIKNE